MTTARVLSPEPEDQRRVRLLDGSLLRVEDVSAERVLLRTVEAPPAPPPLAAPEAAFALPLPGGGQAEVRVTERAADGRGAGEPAAVALRYDSPALGALDLRRRLDKSFGTDTASLAAADSAATLTLHLPLRP